ncbi:hypothetical protein MJO52_15385 [Microbulbifer variabilis]|uniref:Uncharacterized protein n=1 Tax=Microbulbifer variabilis TaxID=266805 RepID=A0ABY4VDE5_9GAMM|nr:hypothetical protein [Microbulbifer variabilis]USD20447.1 hypothetical protein MJO52_15385 [Microbulbifer variabilis]
MKSYLVKWIFASLVVPTLVALFEPLIRANELQQLVLLFWPSSLVLMSLGANPEPISDVVYAWVIALSLNILFYVIIGLAIKAVVNIKKCTDAENS